MRPAAGQVDDLLGEIRARVAEGERVLVTTLTKRMAEELTDYYAELGVAVRYLHSDIQTLERMDIIRELREGKFDVLVGINLLREGLDIPEVSLVAILDADKEGFLRSTRSLIQTIGRAARNVNGRVILYADQETESIRADAQRDQPPPRDPAGVQRGARHHAAHDQEADHEPPRLDLGAGLRDGADRRGEAGRLPPHELAGTIERLRREMRDAAKELEFERAAELRDRIRGARGPAPAARLGFGAGRRFARPGAGRRCRGRRGSPVATRARLATDSARP